MPYKVLAVPRNEELWAGTDLWRVDAVQTAYGGLAWHRQQQGGTAVRLAVLDPSGADWRHYLLFRRACADPDDWQAYVAFVPQACDLETLVGVAARCWCIEYG